MVFTLASQVIILCIPVASVRINKELSTLEDVLGKPNKGKKVFDADA
jgi:hypothetical protein